MTGSSSVATFGEICSLGLIECMHVEIFGLCAVSMMLIMYAFEDRAAVFVRGFAAACAASSRYAVLIPSRPFAIVEGIGSVVALRRR